MISTNSQGNLKGGVSLDTANISHTLICSFHLLPSHLPKRNYNLFGNESKTCGEGWNMPSPLCLIDYKGGQKQNGKYKRIRKGI